MKGGRGVEKGLQRKLGDGDRKWQACRKGGNVRIVKWNKWKGKIGRKMKTRTGTKIKF